MGLSRRYSENTIRQCAEENHRIVMKLEPIMEEEEIEEVEEIKSKRRRKSCSKTQKPLARTTRERVSVRTARETRERYSQCGGDDDGERGGAKGKRMTARRGTKVRCRREKGDFPSSELPRGLYGPFDLRRSSLLPRSIDTSYFYG